MSHIKLYLIYAEIDAHDRSTHDVLLGVYSSRRLRGLALKQLQRDSPNLAVVLDDIKLDASPRGGYVLTPDH